jgi:Zn-dependent protease/CBS domain-containing protein
MNKQNISLGRILGIPITLDLSWFLVFALLTWSLATSVFPSEFKRWPVTLYWIVGAATALMLFVSVLLHELGHSIVARRYKIVVRRITLFFFGGVAEIGSEPPSALAEFWIALAGPAVSLALVILFASLQPVAQAATPLLALTRYLAYINGSLVLFNLIPAFPLDGGRIFRSAVWGVTHNLRRATRIAAGIGRFIAFLFILSGVWQILAGNWGNGLWIAFIGWYLQSAATSQVQQQTLHDALAGHRVQQVMSHNYAIVPAGTTLQQLIAQYVLGNGQSNFIVEQDGMPVGWLSAYRIREIATSDWPTTTVGQIMISSRQFKWARPDEDLWDAMAEMERNGLNQMPVMAGNQIMGLLRREDILRYLRALREFGSAA